MIATVPTALLSATVTVLIVFYYMQTVVRVSLLRLRLGIKAPVSNGPPEFERASRVQMNTLEQMAVVLPLLWVATLYQTPARWLAPLTALVWVIARVIYQFSYMANPDNRIVGWIIGGACNLVLLVLAVWGVAITWVRV